MQQFDVLSLSEWTDIVTAIATVGSLLFVGNQIRQAKRNSHSIFINQITQEFSSLTEYISELLSHEYKELTDVSEKEFEESYNIISPVLSFFEKLEILLDQKAVSMEEVDLLFRKRFFSLMANPYFSVIILENPKFAGSLDLILHLKLRWLKHISKQQSRKLRVEKMRAVFVKIRPVFPRR